MQKTNKKKTILWNISLLLIVMVVFFIIAEISVAVFTDTEKSDKKMGNLLSFIQKSDNPKLLFELIPGEEGYFYGKYVRINSEGFRDAEHSIIKPNNTFRIIAIGDSITFGQGVDITESYSKILENILNEKNEINVEIITLAVPKYTGTQYLELIKTEALKFNPDMILIGHYLNDLEPLWDIFETASSIPVPIKDFLKENSYLYNWVRKRTNEIKNKVGILKFPAYKTLYEQNSSYWRDYITYLHELKLFSEENKLPVSFVLLPNWAELNDSYPYKNENELLVKTLNELGFSSIDIFSKIKGVNSEEFQIFNDDFAHPNYEGHKLCAEVIAEDLNISKYIHSSNGK